MRNWQNCTWFQSLKIDGIIDFDPIEIMWDLDSNNWIKIEVKLPDQIKVSFPYYEDICGDTSCVLDVLEIVMLPSLY